jgi:hypothetical protein
MNPIDIVSGLLAELWQWVKGLFSMVRGAWLAWVAAGGITATLSLFDWTFDMVASGAEALATTAATVASFTHSLPTDSFIMSMVARCIPLNYLLLGELFLLTCYVLAVIVRWVKSWIPTVS